MKNALETLFTMDNLSAYNAAIFCLGAMCALLILQLLLADVVGILKKHTPGMPIDGGHDDFMFRSTRVAANTNETFAAFVGSLVFCLLVSANASWVNNLAMLYLAGRIGHMVCYYLNWKLARSSVFALTIISIAGLAGLGLATMCK